MNQATTTAVDRLTTIRTDLLSLDQREKYQQRVAELTAALIGLELCGDTAQLSQAIGTFHLLKGKIEAYEELLADHKAAVESPIGD